jgi:tRNA (guanine-N7-)-methyltransferase
MIPPRETDPAPAPAPDEDKPHPLHRRLKSFVKRGGRTTEGQARAYELYGPQFLLPYQPERLDPAAAFGRDAPTVLEIGFGMGEATAHIAGLMPEKNFLCCEVHEPGVGALLKRIGELGLTNIRICAHDAVDVIDHMLAPGVLACTCSFRTRGTRRATTSAA